MVDLHSHLLPGVDDGSQTPVQSQQVMERFVGEGITGLCLTPHLSVSRADQGGYPDGWDRAFDAIKPLIPNGLTVYRGSEMMLDRPLTLRAADRRYTIAATRYLLVEFPRLVAATAVEAALAQVSKMGLVPLLAHPERYHCGTVELVRRWKGVTGALMQVDATTITAATPRGERARQLLAHGLADILAADNHGDGRTLGTARRMLQERHGAVAKLLLESNPSAIVRDDITEEVPPIRFRSSLLQRIRSLMARGD